MSEDLEKTKVLDDLGEISSAMEESENRLEEIKEELNQEETLDPVPTREELHKNQQKKSLKERWNGLSKKAKALWISGIILVLALVIGIIVYFVCFSKKEETPVPEPTPEAPIYALENYQYQDGKLTFLNNKKEAIGTYECTNHDEKLCGVAYSDNKEDNFDEPRRIYEDNIPIEMRLNIYYDQFAFIIDHKEGEKELFQLYDMKEEKILGVYQSVKAYAQKENKLILKNTEGKVGYYEITNEGLKEIIKPSYDYLGIISDEHYKTDDILVAKEKNAYYLITNTNKKITKAITSPIIGYNDHVIAAGENNKYALYNNLGEPLAKDIHDYIHIGENYYMFHDNGKLTAYLNSGVKLNEVGIAIGKSDAPYPVKIYSKDGEFKEEKTLYSVIDNISNGELTVSTGDTEKTLNIYDGIASKDKTVGYYDGILYIYDNAESHNILGTYRCSTLNKFDKDNYEKEWAGCHIANRDTSHISGTSEFVKEADKQVMPMPVYANKYVFIEDDNVKLYDLKAQKILASYYKVYDRALTGEKTANEGTILAQNKDKKYGVISISAKEPSNILKFQYDTVEYAKNGYYAKEGNTWHIFDTKGNETKTKLSARIKNHSSKAAAVEEDGKYYIYKLDGTKLQEDGFAYILTSDEFYVTVTPDNKLMAYDYDGNALMNESAQLNSKNYYGVDKPSFKVEKSGNTLHVNVLENDNYISTSYNTQEGTITE